MRHRREQRRCVLGQGSQAFQLHVATVELPLVVLLQQQRADQPHDGRLVGKDTHDLGAALDLRVEPLQRIGAVDLRPMGLGKRHERQHVGLGLVHHRGELREALAQLIGHRSSICSHNLEA